jgi:succinate dehydrogenase / fumarate reductase iron-sulfur subunit
MTMLKVSVRVFRYKEGGSPHYDIFTIEIADTAHVIDAIDIIWAKHDHSLTFRRACHHSSCGSCGLRINGIEKLPCITKITDVWDGAQPIQLDPLRNFPIISDLVIDVSSFFQRMSASEMVITREAESYLPVSVDKLESVEQHSDVEQPDNLSRFIRFENCIECGLCMSACPTMASDMRFWGPAGLAAIYQARHTTDDPQKIDHLLALADGEHGVWRCHSAYECLEVCPQAVNPAGKIMALRQEMLARRIKKNRR